MVNSEYISSYKNSLGYKRMIHKVKMWLKKN